MSRSERVEITGIAAGGAGVGRLADGRAIFVHRTAPGDLAEVRVVEEKRSWARGELVRLQRSAPERRPAPCPHYDRCGGCTLEHLEYSAQLAAKARIVADAFQRIGGLEVEAPEVVPSPAEFRYRNRVSFTLLRLGGDRVVAGFHEIGRPARIVDITEACLLPEPAIAKVWGHLRTAWGPNAQRLPSGRRLRLTLRASAGGEVALVIDGGFTVGRPNELLRDVPGLAAIWHRPAGRGSPLRLIAGREELSESWEDEEVGVSGAVFLQVNRGAAALLEGYVLDRAGDVDGLRVVDAYCGVGMHARRLAREGARVVGIELDEAAVEAARAAAPEGATFLAGRVEDLLGDALPADLVILNPPRAGLEATVPERLRAQPPDRLLYISCNPATLARDVSRLGPGFRVESIRCFDLFPQTSHVETVLEMLCSTA